MALDVDTRRVMRRPSELVRLVRAILDADPQDESSWLEWKRRLDLGSAAGRFHIAKAILGLANRMPSQAQPHCEGMSYIVIGAEPGNLTGVVPMDPAQLEDGLSPYLGGGRGPRWAPTYLEFDGSSVLTVMVEPPTFGDPIYTLRKAYERFAAGTVFVRKNGKTAPADDGDMDLLQERLRTSSAASLELDVGVAGDVPLSWFDSSTVEKAIQEWAEARRLALIAEAERAEQLRNYKDARTGDYGLTMQALAARLGYLSRLSNPLMKQDERTLEEYADEVQNWVRHVEASSKEIWPTRYVKNGNGVMRLRVTNPTDRNLQEVLVKVTFAGDDVVGLDNLPSVDRLPRPPRKYGEPEYLGIVLPQMNMELGSTVPITGHPGRSTWVEEGSVRIGWDVGDLRPRQTEESDDVYVFVKAPLGGTLKGVWEATSKSTNGVLEGELFAPLDEQPVDIVSLLEDD